MKKKREKKNNNKVNIIVMAVFLIAVVILLAVEGTKLYQEYSNTTPYYEVEDRLTQVDETTLGTQYPIGWIRVQGTDIDYPLVYESISIYESGTDYIWTTYVPEGEENRMVVYGHNLRNVSSNPLIADPEHTRFEQLMSFTDYDFAKENQYVQLTLNGENVLYKIYAVSFVTEEGDTGYYTENKEEAETYIKQAKENSLYDYDVDVNGDDKIISLVTCTRYFGIDGPTQFRVDLRKVRDDEKITKSKVTTTDNYDIIK